jgi:hypothetical protein
MLVYTAEGGVGYTLDVHIAGCGGEGHTLHVHTAGCVHGYSLHYITSGEEEYTLHVPLLTVERDTPCTSIHCWRHLDTPCTSTPC